MVIGVAWVFALRLVLRAIGVLSIMILARGDLVEIKVTALKQG